MEWVVVGPTFQQESSLRVVPVSHGLQIIGSHKPRNLKFALFYHRETREKKKRKNEESITRSFITVIILFTV